MLPSKMEAFFLFKQGIRTQVLVKVSGKECGKDQRSEMKTCCFCWLTLKHGWKLDPSLFLSDIIATFTVCGNSTKLILRWENAHRNAQWVPKASSPRNISPSPFPAMDTAAWDRWVRKRPVCIAWHFQEIYQSSKHRLKLKNVCCTKEEISQIESSKWWISEEEASVQSRVKPCPSPVQYLSTCQISPVTLPSVY